jgi:hypothetical protein
MASHAARQEFPVTSSNLLLRKLHAREKSREEVCSYFCAADCNCHNAGICAVIRSGSRHRQCIAVLLWSGRRFAHWSCCSTAELQNSGAPSQFTCLRRDGRFRAWHPPAEAVLVAVDAANRTRRRGRIDSAFASSFSITPPVDSWPPAPCRSWRCRRTAC